MSHAVCRCQRDSVSLAGHLTFNSSTSLLNALQLVESGALHQLDIVAHHEAYECRPFTEATQGLGFAAVRAKITPLYSSPGGDKPPARCYPHSKYLMTYVYEMEATQGRKSMALLDTIH